MEGVQGKMIGSKKEGNIYLRKKKKMKKIQVFDFNSKLF